MPTVVSTAVANAITLGVGGVSTDLFITGHGAIAPAAAGATAVFAPRTTAGRILNRGQVIGGTGVAHYTPGGTGGTGIELAGAQALLNEGMIGGGYGGYGYYGGVGGSGGVGVSLDAAGRLDNAGTIFGGHGSEAQSYRGIGGTGGVGVALGAAASASNSGAILGGSGGIDYNEEAASYGTCGNGGAGATLASSATLVTQGLIQGGAGGQYQFVGTGDYFYDLGGAGGTGVAAAASGTLINLGAIIGGAGGGGFFFSEGAGTGVLLSGAGLLTNNGVITGGGGGFISYNNGSGGGTGVELANRGDLANTGTVTGGVGGGARFGTGGNGGTGVYLNGGTLTNSGTIAGGAGGRGYYGTGKTGQAVAFGPLHGTLINAQGGVIAGAITGFGAGDVIDDRGVRATTAGFANHTLTLYNALHDAVASLTLAGALTGPDFVLHSDGQGGTDITAAASIPAALPAGDPPSSVVGASVSWLPPSAAPHFLMR